jgi:uncharacterized membrane protein YbhN (UPF0104 family)
MKKVAQYIFSIGLTLLFGYLALAGVEFSALWQTVQEVTAQSVIFIVAITLVRIGLRTWRWQMMMRSFAGHIGYVVTYLAVAICYAANVVVPRSGDILRAVLLGWSDRAAVGPLLGSVAAERVFDVLLLALLAGSVFTLLAPQHMSVYSQLAWSIPLVIVAAGLLLLLMSLFAAGRFALVVRLVGRISPRLGALVEPHIAAVAQGMDSLRRPRQYAAIAGVSLLLHLSYAGLIYVGYWGMGLTAAYGLGVEAALLTMVVSAVSFFVPTPAGIGPFHFFFKEALTTFYAVPPTEALACATVVHATYNLTYLVAGGLAALAVQGRRWWQDRSTA